MPPRSPHPATVAQPKLPFGAAPALPPHPATVARIAQPKRPLDGPPPRSPHPATLSRAQHPRFATLQRTTSTGDEIEWGEYQSAPTFSEETYFCRSSGGKSSADFSWLAGFHISLGAGLLIQHLVRVYTTTKDQQVKQEFYEMWETNQSGKDKNGVSIPMDQFASSLPLEGKSWHITGVLYFVPESAKDYTNVFSSFKKGTEGVPEEITMPTALVVNGDMGAPVWMRVLVFDWTNKSIDPTLSVQSGLPGKLEDVKVKKDEW